MKVYKNHYCKCGCGKRIPYPINKKTKLDHKLYGIPAYIHGHNLISCRNRFKKEKLHPNYGGKWGFKKGRLNPNYGGKWGFKKGQFAGKKHPRFIDGFCHKRGDAIKDSLRRGFPVPIMFNEPNEDYSFHHLAEEYGLWIPKEIHKSNRHSLDDPPSMKKINSLIDMWLDTELEKLHQK